MRIVAIETSSTVGGVAVCHDDRILKEAYLRHGLEHGRELVPMLKHLLSEVGWQPWTVELLAVDVGPGSYTGLRIGVICAKVFSFVTGCKCVGVCSTDVLAENAPSAALDVCVLVDAKWKQVYGAIYRGEKQYEGYTQRYTRILGPVACEPEEFAHEIPRRCWLVGDGIRPYRKVLARPGLRFTAEKRWTPRPGFVGVLGFRKYLCQGADDVDRLLPMYLRPSAAEQRSSQYPVRSGQYEPC